MYSSVHPFSQDGCCGRDSGGYPPRAGVVSRGMGNFARTRASLSLPPCGAAKAVQSEWRFTFGVFARLMASWTR